MALIDEENGLRGGEPTYNMPQNTPLINWNGPTGLMTLLQFQPKVETPILKKDSGKLPKTLKGKLRGYVNEQERIDNRIDELNNEVYSEMPKYNNDFGRYQQENGDKIKELQTLVYQKQGLKEASINVERIKDEYEKKIALMDSNSSSGNIVYKNGQVMINPETNKLMNYGDYMKLVGEKDESLNEIDFFPDIVNLNKKQGLGQGALNDYIRSAADKSNGSKWSNEGDPSKIKELTTSDIDPITGEPVDANAYKLTYITGASGGKNSNVKNINDALGYFVKDGKGGYDISSFMEVLTPLQKQDLMDDYLRVAQNYVNKADLTPSETNNDFKEYVLRRMITTASPLLSTKTESGQSYNWMPDKWNEKKKEKTDKVYGYMGMLNANTAINTEKVYNPQTQTMENKITQPLSQIGIKGAGDNTVQDITGLLLHKWAHPDLVIGFNDMVKGNIKNGSPIPITSLGSDKCWIGTIENDMNKLSDLGIFVFNATGGAREYIEPKYNYSGKKLSEGGYSEILSPGHLDPKSPYYSGNNKVEATTVTWAIPRKNYPEFKKRVNGLNENYSKVYSGYTSGFDALVKKENIPVTEQNIDVGGTTGDYTLVDVDMKLNPANSDLFDPQKYKQQQFEKKQDNNLETFKKEGNYNNNQMNFYKKNK